MRLEDFVERLENVKMSGGQYTDRCPAHEDKKNSLAAGAGDDGRILVKCYAGCAAEAIVAAMGLTMQDLMPPRQDGPKLNETVYRIPIGPGDVVEHVRIDEPGGKRFFWRRNGQTGLGGLKVRDVPLFRPGEHGDEERVTICEGEKAAIAAGRLGLSAAAFDAEGLLGELHDFRDV